MSAALLASLAARKDEICAIYTRLLRENLAFYRSFPEEQIKASMNVFLGVFLEEALPTWNTEPIVTWSINNLRRRAAQGLGLPEALGLATYLHTTLLTIVASLPDAKIEDVIQLLRFVDEHCTLCGAAVARFYGEALAAAQKELRESESRYRELVECSPDGVLVYRDGRFLYFNRAGAQMLGTTPEALVGASVFSMFPPEDKARVTELIRAAAAGELKAVELTLLRADGTRFDAELMGAAVTFEGIPARQAIFRDVTERRQAAEALQRAAVQEEIITAQEARLRELSTPLIPVSDGVVVMPLVGLVDPARAAQMRQVLLSGIVAAGAKVAILDVTGVPAMDAGVAAALLGAVAAARLLGAEVVLTGITPAAARALVELGVDFGGVVTRATLKDGISHALTRERRR